MRQADSVFADLCVPGGSSEVAEAKSLSPRCAPPSFSHPPCHAQLPLLYRLRAGSWFAPSYFLRWLLRRFWEAWVNIEPGKGSPVSDRAMDDHILSMFTIFSSRK